MANDNNKVVPVRSARDQLRAKIFSADSARPKSMEVEFFGVTVEIRQPSLGRILDLQNDDDRKAAMVDMIIEYAYVPGEQERVFEDADTDTLLGMPWGEDFVRVNDAISKLTGLDIGEEEVRLKKAP